MNRADNIILQVQKISKIFETRRGKIHALENIEFDVINGEIFSIVGPSGCGKTTLLRIISGLIPPTSGRVILNGEELHSPRKDIGFVFQQSNLLPWRSVMQNICLPLEIFNIDNAVYRQKAVDLIDLVGLNGFENERPSDLSGGMRQRTAICRSLVYDPTILLMDEPFGSLDALTREYMNLEILKIWAKSRKTIIFVTHSIQESIFLSHRVMVMTPRPGRISKIIEIDLPWPRELDILSDSIFTCYSRDIRKSIEYHGD